MKLIRELLESRFEVENPLDEIKAELEGDYYVDDMVGENILIVYEKGATDDNDNCVEVTFDSFGAGESVRLRLFVDENEVKEEKFKPHFSSPTSKGYFQADEIANQVHNLMRDAEYHSTSSLKISDLHDDPKVRQQLKARMRRR